LIAWNASPEVLQTLRARHDELVVEAQRLTNEAQSKLEAASAIFTMMHATVLSGHYRAESTSLVDALQTGDFNCVSATILFQTLTTPCGLTVTPVATPSHVYCRLSDDQDFDIQTTCPDWFDYMDRPELQRAAMRRTPGWSPDNEPRELTSVQLIGKIYYNRGVFLLNDELFAAAETNFLQSMQLDRIDASAQENLLATWNNWALAKCSQEKFEEASQLLLAGIQHDPLYGPFQMNDLHVHQRWAQALCKQGKFEAASQLLKSCQKRRPDVKSFEESRKAVHHLWRVQRTRNLERATSAGLHPPRPRGLSI
jgi:tetratricopeptide (TPR) repeat protein